MSNQPGQHYAMFLLHRDGWGQYAIMGQVDAMAAVEHGKGKVAARDMVTGEKITFEAVA